MFKPIIRLLSFFGKEVREIGRQPRLILSLILGPFLILLLFGIGYQGDLLMITMQIAKHRFKLHNRLAIDRHRHTEDAMG